jgi:putative hydrolase of the HAD superfamily
LKQSELNFILDIGNVICEWNPEKLISNIFTDKTEQKDAFEVTVSHPDWVSLDRGTLSLDEVVQKTIERSDLDPSKLESIYLKAPHSLKPIETTISAIKTLLSETHIKFYVLSNMPKHAWEYLQDQYSIWSYFEGIIISSHEGFVKPEQEIFALLCERFRMNPLHCVFFDDLEKNVVAAKQYGMHGELIKNNQLAYRVLYQVAADKGLFFQSGSMGAFHNQK